MNKNKKIFVFTAVLLFLAITATAFLFVSCSDKKGESNTDETKKINENEIIEAETQEPKTIPLEIEESSYYNYDIGYVGNRKDPLYTDALAAYFTDNSEVYIHRFDSRENVKAFLQKLSDASNYYVGDIANALYCHDGSFFEKESVVMLFVLSKGQSVHYGIEGAEGTGDTLKVSVSEHIYTKQKLRKCCWVLSLGVEKEKGYKNYEVSFLEKEYRAADMVKKSPQKIELDFEVNLDYSTSDLEYTLNSVYTGLAYESDIKESALNRLDFSDKITVNFPIHTFSNSEELIEFWGSRNYPEDKKTAVDAFLAGYDDDFFKEKSLITVFANEFGSDTVYKVDRARVQANTLVIELQRSSKGTDYSSGTDSQILAFETNKDVVEKAFYLKAFLNNEDRGHKTNSPNVTTLYTAKNSEKGKDEIFTEALNAEKVKEAMDNITPLSSFRALPVHKFSSKDELQSILGDYGVSFEGKDMLQKYDGEFFEKNYLFAVYLRAYSCDAKYEVDSLYITDDSITYSFKKTEPDGKAESAVWIALTEVEKKYGRAVTAYGSVNDTDPYRAVDTKWEDITENNAYIDKYTNIKLDLPLDKNCDIFTKSLNADKLSERKNIPFHLFTSYGDYKNIVGQYTDILYFSERDFEEKDVYLMYIDRTMAEDGFYQLTREFVDGNVCTMGVIGCNSGAARVELSKKKQAWLVMFYCDKGYYKNITEFNGLTAKDLNEFKGLLG